MSSNSSQPKEYQVSDSDLSLPVVSPQYLLSQIMDRLAALEERDRAREEEIAQLREEIRQKDERIAELERTQFNHGLHGHPDIRHDIEALQSQETTAPAPAVSQSTGPKTAARIEELKARLKRRRGRAAFSDLREEMGLSKSQFSKLARHLDKRIFDIQRHPTKAREKVLILRQQIG